MSSINRGKLSVSRSRRNGFLENLCIAFFTLGIADCQPSEAIRASGTLTVNGKVFELKYAYARADSAGPDREVTVLMTDQPLPAESLESFYKHNDNAFMWDHVEAGTHHGIRFKIQHERDKPLMAIYAKGGIGMIWVVQYKLELTAFDDSQVKGRIRTADPVKTFGNEHQFDVTFQAVVHAAVESPTPAGP